MDRPNGILDYLDFAKRYVADCEERYGLEAVELMLDAAHALMGQGVFRYPRASKLKLADYERGGANASATRRTIATSGGRCRRRWPRRTTASPTRRPGSDTRALRLPEENILYFLEKNSPKLRIWQRELLRIVRNVAQYFYPQRQTKLMNEGCATFVHYTIVNRLYDKGLISEGALLEIVHSHANVVAQFDYNDQRFSGSNPYALGFAMMQDIQRICIARPRRTGLGSPTLRAGNWPAVMRDVWANYRDDPSSGSSCRRASSANSGCSRSPTKRPIRRSGGGHRRRRRLSPRAVQTRRQLRRRDQRTRHSGRRGRFHGRPPLVLHHHLRNGVGLSDVGKEATLRDIRRLWGYEVRLEETSD